MSSCSPASRRPRRPSALLAHGIRRRPSPPAPSRIPSARPTPPRRWRRSVPISEFRRVLHRGVAASASPAVSRRCRAGAPRSPGTGSRWTDLRGRSSRRWPSGRSHRGTAATEERAPGSIDDVRPARSHRTTLAQLRPPSVPLRRGVPSAPGARPTGPPPAGRDLTAVGVEPIEPSLDRDRAPCGPHRQADVGDTPCDQVGLTGSERVADRLLEEIVVRHHSEARRRTSTTDRIAILQPVQERFSEQPAIPEPLLRRSSGTRSSSRTERS